MKKQKLFKTLARLFCQIACILLMVYVILTFVFFLFRNHEKGMGKSVQPGDLVFVDRITKDYRADDVVVFSYKDRILSRRVVAVGGDAVDITPEGLLVNGVLQAHFQHVSLFEGGFSGPYTLQGDEIFVMADEAQEYVDSRLFGPLRRGDTIGEMMFFLRRRNF